MPTNPSLGGLDLSGLASNAQAETSRRIQGGQSHLAASLASMLAEQRAMLDAKAESQARDQTFQRAQAMLAESLARREQSLQEADRMARAQFELEQQGGQPNWYDQQRFQTDENIRQAKAIAAMEREFAERDARRKADEEMPRLSDFGEDAINPLRGQALLGEKPERSGKGFLGDMLLNAGRTVTDEDLAKTSEIIATLGADPQAVISSLRNHFGPRDEAASIALWRLGYLPG